MFMDLGTFGHKSRNYNNYFFFVEHYNIVNILIVFGEDILSVEIGDSVMYLIIQHTSVIQIALVSFSCVACHHN